MRGKVEKYYKPEKVLSIFLFFSTFLTAAHCVAIISKADCGSNSELVSGGNASPTSCGFTHIEFNPLLREAHSPTFKIKWQRQCFSLALLLFPTPFVSFMLPSVCPHVLS